MKHKFLTHTSIAVLLTTTILSSNVMASAQHALANKGINTDSASAAALVKDRKLYNEYVRVAKPAGVPVEVYLAGKKQGQTVEEIIDAYRGAPPAPQPPVIAPQQPAPAPQPNRPLPVPPAPAPQQHNQQQQPAPAPQPNRPLPIPPAPAPAPQPNQNNHMPADQDRAARAWLTVHRLDENNNNIAIYDRLHAVGIQQLTPDQFNAAKSLISGQAMRLEDITREYIDAVVNAPAGYVRLATVFGIETLHQLPEMMLLGVAKVTEVTGQGDNRIFKLELVSNRHGHDLKQGINNQAAQRIANNNTFKVHANTIEARQLDHFKVNELVILHNLEIDPINVELVKIVLPLPVPPIEMLQPGRVIINQQRVQQHF